MIQIKMDSYDYSKAIEVVQKMLDDIEVILIKDPEGNYTGGFDIRGFPKADNIVDEVWDIIST